MLAAAGGSVISPDAALVGCEFNSLTMRFSDSWEVSPAAVSTSSSPSFANVIDSGGASTVSTSVINGLSPTSV